MVTLFECLCPVARRAGDGAIACWFGSWWDCFRFFKAIVAVIIAHVAVSFAFQAKDVVDSQVASATGHEGTLNFAASSFTYSFIFMYIVDLMCLLYSCLGISCIRRPVFEDRDTGRVHLRPAQICLGPCCATFWQIMIWISFGLQISLSYAYLLMGIFLRFLVGICKSGDVVISSFQGFLDSFNDAQSYETGDQFWSPIDWFEDLNVQNYCVATEGMSTASLTCFVGCLLSVVSQVLMVAVISEEKGRIEGTMTEHINSDYSVDYHVESEEKRKKSKRKQRDDSSDSD